MAEITKETLYSLGQYATLHIAVVPSDGEYVCDVCGGDIDMGHIYLYVTVPNIVNVHATDVVQYIYMCVCCWPTLAAGLDRKFDNLMHRYAIVETGPRKKGE